MRIIVNDIAASKSGAITILNQVYNYAVNHSDDEWVFLTGGSYLEERDNIRVIVLPQIKKSHLKKLYFDFFSGRSFIDKLNPDVVLSLQNIITFGVKSPQFVYIHQSIPYQDIKCFSFMKKEERKYAIYQHVIGRIINLSARKADGVIVQTDWMRKAVAKKAHINMSKIEVCFPDIETITLKETVNYEPNLFFYPTSVAIYKNNELIIEACDILNERGIFDYQVYMTLPQGTINHPNISCIDYVSKDEVYRYYQKANLLFPSYIETIGLPLVEAKSINGVIIAAKCPYADNVLHNYYPSFQFDPFDANQLAIIMENVMLNDFKNKEAVYEGNQISEWKKAIDFIKTYR